jgi:hypothetical protein
MGLFILDEKSQVGYSFQPIQSKEGVCPQLAAENESIEKIT